MKVLVRQSFRYANDIVAANQSLDVFYRGTTSRPPLFSPANASTPLSNPVKTDSVGNASFYIEEGLYDFAVFGAVVPFDADAPDGGGVARYTHVQTTPSASWTVHHNLGTVQAPVVVLDSDPDATSWTDMEIIDTNTMALSFDTAVSGKAYF